jgi:hypothetical protein
MKASSYERGGRQRLYRKTPTNPKNVIKRPNPRTRRDDKDPTTTPQDSQKTRAEPKRVKTRDEDAKVIRIEIDKLTINQKHFKSVLEMK